MPRPARGGGPAADVAAEIAFYLAQATDFEALIAPVVAAFAERDVEAGAAGR